jgi:hypothetical protein
MYRKMAELTDVANQRGARIAELEARIKAPQPAPSASIAEPKL